MLPVPQKWRDDPARAELVDLADDFYLTPAEVARRWRVSEGYLANLRRRHAGPQFMKFGGNGNPLYRASSVLRYEIIGLVQTIDVPIRKGKPRGR